MKAHIAWTNGGEATVLEASAGAIRLRSSVPSPPGSRVEGKLVDGSLVRVKVHACQRQDDGSFFIVGRPLDLTREVRERLESVVRDGDEPSA